MNSVNYNLLSNLCNDGFIYFKHCVLRIPSYTFWRIFEFIYAVAKYT